MRSKAIINPNVEKGDKILLIKSLNGLRQYEGEVLEVTRGSKSASSNVLVKALTHNGTWTIYRSNRDCSDEYTLADKKSILAMLKDKEKDLKKELASIKTEIEFHEKYDSMEEFVADKLMGIMKNKDDKESIVEMLKELKRSDFL